MTTMFFQHDLAMEHGLFFSGIDGACLHLVIPMTLVRRSCGFVGAIQLSFWNGLAHFGHRVGFVTRLLSQA